MRTSAKGLALIKEQEGFRARRYLCAAGKPTIGYGHVIQANEAHYNTAVLTEAQASALLQQDVDRKYGAHVAGRVHRDVTQNQFDALVSLCYNIGTGGFDQSSVLALANAGATDHRVIVTAFGLWNKVTDPQTKVKRVSAGLTARRAREAALYIS
ncbi:lysozyme [Hymenobacter cheonanensis]|uniref:lysozyme n=1 Tax=Hymenobacter sp. CA2-7 TaxID=3063993 RepID=UPI0027139E45|nr:lysozyme [Hymenobacter sp. CA2-7]MDO7885377.1 lysozyme [Hymenobacter sp. CA2-7]